MTRQEFKEKCIKLRNEGYTLPELVSTLKRPKTTIYFHIQNIPKSDFLKAKIKENNKPHLNYLHKYLKGRSWLGRHCKGFNKWTSGLVKMTGHFIFDGEFHQATCAYNNRSNVLLNFVRDNMKTIYNYDPKIVNKTGGVIRLCYYNTEVTNFLKEKKEELLNNILYFSPDKQRAFLKAFFDDEGCVTFSKKKRIVRGFQHNSKILWLINKLLLNFNIESKVDARFNELIIGRRENLIKFAKEINFTPGLCVNGKRSNSIWKKDLEKREILKLAINSYSKTYPQYYTRYL